ncbi:hypothetical protein PsAD5_00762 [Pseudovibrio sp. Ad5]|nr:hypothetical protein PsW74_02346 [Pseudovibrio sp. W74]KZL00921.1 hypothetical protein PsAD5_00762 [Pseudovibrio sp. Ad5]
MFAKPEMPLNTANSAGSISYRETGAHETPRELSSIGQATTASLEWMAAQLAELVLTG